MTIDNLLNQATLIKTQLRVHHHNLPLLIERKNSHISAIIDYYHINSDPIDDEFSPTKIDEQVFIAVEPICPVSDDENLFKSLKNISEKIDQFVQEHDQIFVKTAKLNALNLPSVYRAENYPLNIYGHLFTVENLRAYFKLAEQQKLYMTQNYHRKNLDCNNFEYYFAIEKDDTDHAIKVTINHQFTPNDLNKAVVNLELVRLWPKRDEVVLSAKYYLIDELNQDMEVEPDTYIALIELATKNLCFEHTLDPDLNL